MCSPRSQSASTVSGDGSLLHLLSGYSDFSEDGSALATVQSVGLWGATKEEQLKVDSNSISSCLASAVTLSSGDILVTGGQSRARKVVILTGQALGNWRPMKEMLNGRYGHASSSIVSGFQENVIVAGGWDEQGNIQASVELYGVRDNHWTKLQDMPSPRVLFTLQVKH